MAFVAEDGTGLTDANSLGTVEAADAYFSDRGNDLWPQGTDEPGLSSKQQALILATDYIELIFGHRFLGSKLLETQALSWPREGVVIGDVEVPSDAVPQAVQRACFEYAVRALSTELLPDPVIDESGLAKAATEETVGPITVKYQVIGTAEQRQVIRAYPKADRLLYQLLVPQNRAVIR